MILFNTRELRDIRAEVLDPQPVNPNEILTVMLTAGVWELRDEVFASGKPANNKFSADKLFQPAQRPQLRTVLIGLGRLATPYRPDALWGVPSGGQSLALHLGKILDLPVIRLAKGTNEPGIKTFRFKSEATRQVAAAARRKVGVEDIANELTSSAGVMQLSEMADTLAEVVIMRRGDPNLEKDLGIPIEAAVTEHVPNSITPDHPFFVAHGARAVR